jgi:hypothetical protein
MQRLQQEQATKAFDVIRLGRIRRFDRGRNEEAEDRRQGPGGSRQLAAGRQDQISNIELRIANFSESKTEQLRTLNRLGDRARGSSRLAAGEISGLESRDEEREGLSPNTAVQPQSAQSPQRNLLYSKGWRGGDRGNDPKGFGPDALLA